MREVRSGKWPSKRFEYNCRDASLDIELREVGSVPVNLLKLKSSFVRLSYNIPMESGKVPRSRKDCNVMRLSIDNSPMDSGIVPLTASSTREIAIILSVTSVQPIPPQLHLLTTSAQLQRGLMDSISDMFDEAIKSHKNVFSRSP